MGVGTKRYSCVGGELYVWGETWRDGIRGRQRERESQAGPGGRNRQIGQLSFQENGGLCSSDDLPRPTTSNPKQRSWRPAMPWRVCPSVAKE